MRRILDESPDLAFGQAKQLAQMQLLKAAAKRNYRVTTPKQDEERAKRVAAASQIVARSITIVPLCFLLKIFLAT
jgi:hypothetical protein